MRQLVITQSITNRDSRSVDKYLQDIGHSMPVTAEEEVLLAQRIRQGDKEALNQLVTANLRFVVSVAKQYQSQGIPLSDLINEGNIGLMKAAGRFDETRGFKFISYAVWWIRQSIVQSISENGRMIHLPLNKKALYGRILKAQAILQQDLERDPSFEELAALLNANENEVRVTIRSSSFTSSLDAPFANGEEGTLADTLASGLPGTDHRVAHSQSLHLELKRHLSRLSLVEQEVIEKLFGIGQPECSLEEIGRQLQLTGERIRQVRQKALRKLRDADRSALLRTYLE
jgi:RNA polymerase primary sigma factor